MTITEIYEKYHNPPHLQMHQLRVAAVATLICQDIPDFPESKETILGCLLHDVGNLIRYKSFPQDEEWVFEKEPNYWENAKQELIDKYGDNEDVAAIQIATELQIPTSAINVIRAIDLTSNIDQITTPGGFIGNYSDCRVSPSGIVSIKERVSDLIKRYSADFAASQGGVEGTLRYRIDLEERVQVLTSRDLSHICDELAAPVIEKLKKYEI